MHARGGAAIQAEQGGVVQAFIQLLFQISAGFNAEVIAEGQGVHTWPFDKGRH